MSVVLTRTVRLRVGAGAAKPGPAIGQALGPLGLNMAEFCKQFNDKTKNYDKDIPLPVVLSGTRLYLLINFHPSTHHVTFLQHFPIEHLLSW
jgi:ribosomal protein L11